MNNEINKIIQSISDFYKLDNALKYYLDRHKAQIILDYITNLQQSDTDKQLEIMKLKDRLEKQKKEYQETYKDVRIEIKEKNDTITNLQQENEYLKKNNPEQNIEHFRIVKENKRKINNLREENKTLHENNQAMQEEMARVWKENERLKERVAYLERSNNRREDTIIGLRFEVAEQEDYKSRCEKAIEIIEKEKENMGYAKYDSCLLLIENILQNGSDNKC